jgi:hypothetical protein
MAQYRLLIPSQFGGYTKFASVIVAENMASAQAHVDRNYRDPSTVTITELNDDDSAPLPPGEAYRVVRDLIDPEIIGPVEDSALQTLYDLVIADINRRDRLA